MSPENLPPNRNPTQQQPSNNEKESSKDLDTTAEVITDYQTASRHLSSSLNKLLGIIILSLSGIVLLLVIISFFVHPGQPDETSLLIEQITGLALFSLASFIGIMLIVQAKRKEKGKQYFILEPIIDENSSKAQEEGEDDS